MVLIVEILTSSDLRGSNLTFILEGWQENIIQMHNVMKYGRYLL